MLKKRRSLLAFLLVFVMMLSQTVVLAEGAEVYVLEVLGDSVKFELNLTLEDLKAMPDQAQINEEYIYNSKKGEQSVGVKGVSLAYLLKEKAELLTKDGQVKFEASDDYPVPSQELQDVLNEDLKYVLAYEVDGKDLEEITIYRKLKAEGEFNTVFKSIDKIIVGEETQEVEESMEILISEIDWSEYQLQEKTYSTNNSLGFHKIIKVKGYDLLDIIGKDRLEEHKNYNVKFVSSDGFELATTIEELMNTYFFNDFTEGSKESIDPMLAKYTKLLADFPENKLQAPVEWEDMDINEEDLDKDFPKLVYGQTNVDDMNMSKWAKEVVKITIEEIEEVDDTEEVEDTEDDVAEVEDEDIVFTDITEEYEFAEAAIMELAKRGIINGVGNNLYAPEKELTRAQFCKIIVESLGYEKTEYQGGFSDVDSSNWAANYIQTAVDKGLFKGNTEVTFNPSGVITRQEMATVVARAAVIAGVEGSEKIEKFVMAKSDYLDKNDVADWAENAVAWLEVQDVFDDIVDENFYPTKTVNRAETAAIVYNTLFK